MTQVRYFGFVKAEEPWTGNQFKMYAGKNGSTFGSKVPAGSVVECGYKSISSADSAARELKSRCEKLSKKYPRASRKRRGSTITTPSIDVCMIFIAYSAN